SGRQSGNGKLLLLGQPVDDDAEAAPDARLLHTPPPLRGEHRDCAVELLSELNTARRRLSVLQLLDVRGDLVQVEHRQRRAAVRTDGLVREVDRSAAIRAMQRLDVPTQLRDLCRRERTDE